MKNVQALMDAANEEPYLIRFDNQNSSHLKQRLNINNYNIGFRELENVR